MEQSLSLGLDIGSGSAKAVVLDQFHNMLYSCYKPTKGRPLQVAAEIFQEVEQGFAKEDLVSMTCTGTGGRQLANILDLPSVNEIVCHTKGVEWLHPEARTIIDIGGEDAKMILVERSPKQGLHIQDFALNTVCAAGTGAFLEQQAARLGYSIEEFSQLGLKSKNVPAIAGRCTVFAKSDMIHLQQIGAADYEIIVGLCFAIVRNLKTNIARGKKIIPPLVFQGGVAANLGVRRAVRELLVQQDRDLIIPKHFKLMGCLGAALIGLKTDHPRVYPGLKRLLPCLDLDLEDADRMSGLKPIAGQSCDEPGRSLADRRLHRDQSQKIQRVYLGLDVGSVSTNLVLLTIDGNEALPGRSSPKLLAKSYLPTAGRPLEAVKQGLTALRAQVKGDFQVAGVGSTGSGRFLCGDFLGADVIRNEITAQATAARAIEPGVETIFEIGGQDSKYISLKDGVIVDFTMNKVCAAGTGSFLEEQSVRLDIGIEKFGELALSGSRPVKMGERCTVFMQSDLVHFQQRGVSGPNLAAGLCYSVVANYLNKVVERRAIGETILFQGGTALNKGIVAAFEQVLDKRVLVPENNEVSGAIGAALLAAQAGTGPSRFKGFDLSDRSYTTEVFECQGCLNLCEIRKITLEGEDRPMFYGHRCEKYDPKISDSREDQPDLVRERERVMEELCPRTEAGRNMRIGIPRALFLQEWFPFFSALFQYLGYTVVLSDQTNKTLTAQGASLVVTETCLPIKAAHGHVRNLIDKGLKRIFLPQISELPGLDQTRPGKVCPYVQGLPWTIRAAYDFQGEGIELLSPVLHLGRGQKGRDQEWKALARSLGCNLKTMRKGVNQAWNIQNRITERFRQMGRAFLQEVEAGKKAVLIVGRPYNALDPGMNMDLSQKLKKLGILAVPLDFLPWEESVETGEMYWAYGQKILAAGELLRKFPDLYPVFVTNFSCGPDAFILHFFQKQIGSRPFLELEIDEHTADAGVLTRLEAFWDSIPEKRTEEFGCNLFSVRQSGYRKDLILYLPNMCDHLHPFAAALAANGVQTRMCLPSDDETMRLGRTHTKGKECLPAVITTGDILKVTRQADFDPEHAAFFMPAAGGPCRFGLYHLLHRLVLDQVGLQQVAVYAPSQSFTLYEDLGILGSDFSKRAWKGVVAVDFLQRFVQETRPYVSDRSECQKAYTYFLNEISRAVFEGQDLLEILFQASKRFQAFRVREEKKPVVGIVGEIYVRSNPFANEYLVQNLEELGVEAWLPSIGEWIHYMNHTAKLAAWREGEGKGWLKMVLEIFYQNRIEKRLAKKEDGWLRSAGEPKAKHLLRKASPFIHQSFEGEAILSIGKSLDYMDRGVDGIINVMPFTCMPGGVVDAVFRRLKRVKDIPMMSLTYDGQTRTNTGNRLEAFVHQVHSSHDRVALSR